MPLNPSDIHALSNEQLNIACAKAAHPDEVVFWDAEFTRPKYSTDASAAMELLDLLDVGLSELLQYAAISFHTDSVTVSVFDDMGDAVIEVEVLQTKPSVALPRAIAEAFLIYSQSKVTV